MIMEKLDILLETNTIDSETHAFVLNTISILEEQGINAHSDAAHTFLVHLAMAAARQKIGETIGLMDAFVIEQVMEDPNYPRALEIWKILDDATPVKFCEEEITCFYLHLCNVLRG